MSKEEKNKEKMKQFIKLLNKKNNTIKLKKDKK